MRRSSFARVTKLTGASACALLAFAVPASAATINVNTTNDELNSDGDCALREATIAANTDAAVSGCTPGSGADTISVPNGTYALTIEDIENTGVNSSFDPESGDLDTCGTANIDGASTRGVIVDAQGIDRVFDHLRNEDCPSSEPGAALSTPQGARTVISDLTVTGGLLEAQQSAGGGGIRSFDDITLLRLTITDNEDRSGYGGAFYPNGNSTRISRSTLSNNRSIGNNGGGAIHSDNGTVSIDNSTLSGNSSDGDGGAILEHSIFVITDSTIVDNVADSRGGGIGQIDSSAPSGGGDDSTTIRNTIVANNRANENPGSEGPPANTDNCDGTPDSQGSNLENLDTCSLSGTGDKPNTPARVRPLANNGGPTDTHALAPASEAVDGGNSDARIDQRGIRRPQNGDSTGPAVDDIGAFELVPPVTAANNSYSTREDTRLDVPSPGVLGNDSGGLGTLEAQLVNGPDHGALTLRSDGSFTYTPDRNYNGPDSFTYRACDDSTPRQCDTATVNIRVTPVDDGGTGGEGREPCTIQGTDSNDILRGTPGADVICGGDGNDVIYGGGGNDIIRGGAGNDVLRGDDGDDEITGGAGSDNLVGGEGNDDLEGGAGADDLTGQGGNDTLDASDGVRANDVANGGPGSDTCSRDPGDEETSC